MRSGHAAPFSGLRIAPLLLYLSIRWIVEQGNIMLAAFFAPVRIICAGKPLWTVRPASREGNSEC
jgi:hypothetical protein